MLLFLVYTEKLDLLYLNRICSDFISKIKVENFLQLRIVLFILNFDFYDFLLRGISLLFRSLLISFEKINHLDSYAAPTESKADKKNCSAYRCKE